MTRSRQSTERRQVLTNDIKKAKLLLESINWTFDGKGVLAPEDTLPLNCRKHHWFPATFIPEIPFTLIEILTQPQAVVLDPFAGIGTTYFQALLLGRRPIAMDICFVAVEYMRALKALMNPELDTGYVRTIVAGLLEGFDPHRDYASRVQDFTLVDRLRPWYSPGTLNQVCFLAEQAAKCSNATARAALRASVSGVLKTASSQDRGWGCIADNVHPQPHQIKDKDAIKLCRRRFEAMLRDVSEHVARAKMPGYIESYRYLSSSQTIFYEDSRECTSIPDSSVDLVLTSPPYPNMTDYVTSQRLSYYFFGIDPTDQAHCEDKKREIGARIKRFRKDSLDQYLNDMARANDRICSKVKAGGYLCYVMPVFRMDSANNKARRSVIQRILSDMESHGVSRVAKYDRILPRTRRSHNSQWATLERERLHIFVKS